VTARTGVRIVREESLEGENNFGEKGGVEKRNKGPCLQKPVT